MNNTRIYAAALFSGACAMVVELAGARVIAPYLGNTIYTWSAVIGLVLTALSIGYYVGGRLGDKYKDRKQLSLIFLLAAVSTLIIPFLAKVLVPFTLLFDIATASLIASIILVPASMFYGMVSPYTIKLIAKKDAEGSTSGNVFALSTVGSIIGVLLTGFVLIPNLSLTHVFILAAVIMLLAGWLVHGKLNFLDAGLFAIGIILLSNISFSPLFDGSIVYQANTEYYLITVMENASFWSNSTRLLVLDNGLNTGQNPDGSLLFSYMLIGRKGYAIVPNPENALVMGVGGGAQIEDLKKSYPNLSVDGVEIDQKVIDTGKKYFSLNEDDRTHIIIDDARRYIKTTDKNYDIIVIDVYRGLSIPVHLLTREFVAEVKAKTNKNGVVVINLVATPEGKKSEFFSLVHNTYSSVFKNVIVMPCAENTTSFQNIVIIATDANVDKFKTENKDIIYEPKIKDKRIITDDWNPSDVLAR